MIQKDIILGNRCVTRNEFVFYHKILSKGVPNETERNVASFEKGVQTFQVLKTLF